MKLHLPKLLLTAILTMCSVPFAWADYTWAGGTGTYTASAWATESNWTPAPSTDTDGPGTPNSNIWDAVTVAGDGTENSLEIGSTSDRVTLEGWAPRFTVKNGANLYSEFVKFQTNAAAGEQWLSVTDNSTLDAVIGVSNKDGNEGSTITISVTESSNFILRVNKAVGGEGIIVDWDATSSVSILSNDSTSRNINALTLNAGISDFSSATYSEVNTLLGTIDLNLSITGVTFSNFTLNLGDAFEGWRQVNTEITDENARAYGNCYYIKQENGAYSVVFANADPDAVVLEWQGGSLAWSKESVFANETSYSEYANVQFTTSDASVTLEEDITASTVTIDEGVSVILDGGSNLLTAAQGIDVKGALQLSNIEVDAGSVSGDLELADGAKLSVYDVGDGTTFSSTAGTNTEIVLNDGGVVGGLIDNYYGTLKLAGGEFDVHGDFVNNGTIEIGDVTVNAQGANWNMHGNINVTGQATVAGAAFYIEDDCTLTMMDGSGLTRTTMAAYQIRGSVVVADGATATISTVDDIHFNYGHENSENAATFRLGEGATLNLTAAKFQNYNHANSKGSMELGANSTLNIDCATLQAEGLQMTLNNGAKINLKSTNSQNLGQVTLNNAQILSEIGGSDNRVISIQSLTGSGELIGSSWNVIWTIGELNGAGDVTWKNNGTHWAPSVLHINGGTYTGTLTADRITGQAGARGNYQSVLQINANGAETMAGAVVNLNGNGTNAYVQMAMNADEVSIGGLEGTQHAHIFAGEATIQGGSNSTSLVASKSGSTRTSTLNLNSDTNHTYAGSVDADISISKGGVGKQTFSGDMSSFNGSVEALEGELAFTSTDALNVASLTVGNAGTLTVANGENVGLISTSGDVSLTGGATINASLTLGNGATLEMDELVTDAVTVNGVLTFGGQLTMGDKLQEIVLEMAAWPTPELVLFDGLTSFTFGETLVTAGAEVQASEYFSDISDDTLLYVTYRQVDNVGSLVMFSIVPEPATTTLSLLALAGLAARRRRR